jgi:hypothetical protein
MCKLCRDFNLSLPEGGVNKFRNFKFGQVLQRKCYLVSWGSGGGVGEFVACVEDGIVPTCGLEVFTDVRSMFDF